MQNIKINLEENYHSHYAMVLEEAMKDGGLPTLEAHSYGKNRMGCNGNHRVWQYKDKWFVVTNDKEKYSFFKGDWSVICFSEKPLILEMEYLGNAERYGKGVIKLKPLKKN